MGREIKWEWHDGDAVTGAYSDFYKDLEQEIYFFSKNNKKSLDRKDVELGSFGKNWRKIQILTYKKNKFKYS